jgi:hypothetical protein
MWRSNGDHALFPNRHPPGSSRRRQQDPTRGRFRGGVTCFRFFGQGNRLFWTSGEGSHHDCQSAYVDCGRIAKQRGRVMFGWNPVSTGIIGSVVGRLAFTPVVFLGLDAAGRLNDMPLSGLGTRYRPWPRLAPPRRAPRPAGRASGTARGNPGSNRTRFGSGVTR